MIVHRIGRTNLCDIKNLARAIFQLIEGQSVQDFSDPVMSLCTVIIDKVEKLEEQRAKAGVQQR
jgi:hypothetical protein